MESAVFQTSFPVFTKASPNLLAPASYAKVAKIMDMASSSPMVLLGRPIPDIEIEKMPIAVTESVEKVS